jgi:hypothetical protein
MYEYVFTLLVQDVVQRCGPAMGEVDGKKRLWKISYSGKTEVKMHHLQS